MPKTNKAVFILALAASLFFLAMAVFIVMQMGSGSWFRNIKAEITSQPYARTITVSGDGKITAKPDLAYVTLSVSSTGKTVKEVTSENNTKMNKVIEELKKLTIAEKDIATTEYYLSPEYDSQQVVYSPVTLADRKLPKIIGYSLNQSLGVKIRNLEIADQVLDIATASGANQVSGLSFQIDDTSNFKQEARAKAFQTAREKAQQMANSAGVKLGRVVTFSESFGDYPMPYANFAMNKTMMAEDSSVAPQLQPGSQDLNVNVTVTYEIE